MDIMGTICEIAGVKTKNKLDGVNLLPFLKTKNKAMPHDVLFWRKWEQNAMAIRSDKLKLVANRDKSKTPPALYNLEQDLIENYNLRESNKTEVTNLMSLWEQWDKNNKERYFPTYERINGGKEIQNDKEIHINFYRIYYDVFTKCLF